MFAALQEASLRHRQAREAGHVSGRLQVPHENLNANQVQCGRAHQEKGSE